MAAEEAAAAAPAAREELAKEVGVEEAVEESTKVVVSAEEKKPVGEEEEAKPELVVEQEEEGEKGKGAEQEGAALQKGSSFKDESNFPSDLKEHERKALLELRAMVEKAILGNTIFAKEEEKKEPVKEKKNDSKENAENKQEGEAEREKPEDADENKQEGEADPEKPEDAGENKQLGETDPEKPEDAGEKEAKSEEPTDEDARKEASAAAATDPEPTEAVDPDVSLWGVPLLPSRGSEKTDVVLLKFLRAREYKVKDAFEMLRSTLRWRRDSRIESILEEETLGAGLEAAAYMDGTDREGHPVCYNLYGVFQDKELYDKTFGSEESVEKFLRWRFQLMERGIQRLDLRPGGVASMLQITDLKNSPGVSKKELRAAMKRAVDLLQDNYPEFVARNIFINVPFWYYAVNALLSPFLSQRTRSKFVSARPAKVTETLLKYIPAEDVPVCYGGLKRENDTEFSVQDGGVSELIVKAGSVENVEIPMPEVGTTLVWDVTVLGWEVNYKEEFVPTDEGSYTILLQKGRKMGSEEEPVRNSFKNNEPGKVVLIIENNTFWKKKALFRYKAKSSS